MRINIQILWLLLICYVPITQADDLRIQQLAATCLSCHPRQADNSSAIISLYGRQAALTQQALLAFRNNERSGKVMPQLSKGLSLPQIDRLSNYFATQTKKQ